MNRSSRFGVVADLKKSHGAYLYDIKSQNYLLDFFGQYSSLAVGYNHKIFSSTEFIETALSATKNKLTNCEISSEIAIEFDKTFREFAGGEHFSFFHYACTGALGVEAAIKTAIDYTGRSSGQIITFKNSFHGINSYGGIVTDRDGPAKMRLKGFPGAYWPHIDSPVINFEGTESFCEKRVFKTLEKVEAVFKGGKDVCCILLEPIQCTAGDRYFPKSFFSGLRSIATQYDVPLIFDEVQSGFCVSGTKWYWEQTGIVPDIVIFGKKTQLSGIMVQRKFAEIFKRSIRLEVTWDADIVDMLRCSYVIKAYEQNNVLHNVAERSRQLIGGIKGQPLFENLRHRGLLVAFDLIQPNLRDEFVNQLKNNGMLCSPAVEKTIRLRPHPLVNSSEIEAAVSLLNKTAHEMNLN